MRELKEVFEGRLRKLWNSVEIRVLVLLSLFLQIVLISTGNRRKYIKKKWVGVIIWLCYLSADVVATIALGVLSRAAGDEYAKSEDQHSYAIMGLWGAFLLMHLGGPDSITAYALADNELWSRHFLGLIGQVGVAIYVLLRSWITTPINYLWFAIFAAGILKYGERTLVLFWASRDEFRKWMVSPPDPGPNYAKFMDEFVSKECEGFDVSLGKVIDIVSSDSRKPDVAQGVTANATVRVVPQDAYPYFLTFRQLFADLILSFQDKKNSLSYFSALSWDKAFDIVEIELGLIYDLFYTKASLLYSRYGFIVRLLILISTVAALVAFPIMHKNAYPKTEVIITYILLVGAILIEIYAVMIFLSSDWFKIWLSKELTSPPERRLPMNLLRFYEYMLMLTVRNWEQALKSALRRGESRPSSTSFTRGSNIRILSWLSYLLPARLRWSNAMGQYNVLGRCIEIEPHIICQYLQEYLIWNGKSVPEGLKVLIFDELKLRVNSNDGEKKLGRYRGDMILLQEMNCFEKIDEVEFDQSVLLWHMATDFCYHTEVDENNKPEETWLYKVIPDEEMKSSLPQDFLKFIREISVLISNYMVHLLITSPFMLPSGIGQIRLQDTRAEAIEFFDGQKNISASEACKMLINVDTRLPPSKVKGDRSKSLLFDACRLAKSLQLRETSERWEKITQAWLDILTFAAAQCKWNDHAEKLSQGGELLTHVWLLMAHFGMTDQFQISKGHERVKLNLK